MTVGNQVSSLIYSSLVACRLWKPEVVGSNPAIPTSFKTAGIWGGLNSYYFLSAFTFSRDTNCWLWFKSTRCHQNMHRTPLNNAQPWGAFYFQYVRNIISCIGIAHCLELCVASSNLAFYCALCTVCL